MTILSFGPLYVGFTSAADCSAYGTNHAYVVHLWRVRLELDRSQRQDHGPAQKDHYQPGHGSDVSGYELASDA